MKKILLILILFFLMVNFVSAIPSYKLGIIPEKYTINKDESVRITITASGGGPIEKAKMMIYSDEKVKIKINENEGYKWSNVFLAIDSTVFTISEEYQDRKDIHNTFPLKSEFTSKIQEISLKSDESGDHVVLFVFSYTENNETWYTDRLEFEFHVNSWWDNWQGTIGFIGIMVALIIGILSIIPTTLRDDKLYKSKIFWIFIILLIIINLIIWYLFLK